ncbi:hypothetical protein RP20_CCG015092 [Aedes albopictus]|nr:hypothetical protein RP20_CCG015092 [Aedes albopictus]
MVRPEMMYGSDHDGTGIGLCDMRAASFQTLTTDLPSSYQCMVATMTERELDCVTCGQPPFKPLPQTSRPVTNPPEDAG